MPEFNIITVNLNNKEGLRKTIESVITQSYRNFHFIIIDGGSTDGSKELIESYSDQLFYWISENDSGIYNAMNKGLKEAKGDYVQFLNSGDCLVNSQILKYVSECINSTESKYDLYYSDVINSNTKRIHKYPEILTFKYFYEFTINHQSAFLKRTLFDKYGFYSEQYKIVSDWEFFIKILFLQNCSYLHLDKPAIYFDFDNGLSTSPESIELMNYERTQVFEKHFSNLVPDFAYFKRIEESNTWKLFQKVNKLRSWKRN